MQRELPARFACKQKNEQPAGAGMQDRLSWRAIRFMSIRGIQQPIVNREPREPAECAVLRERMTETRGIKECDDAADRRQPPRNLQRGRPHATVTQDCEQRSGQRGGSESTAECGRTRELRDLILAAVEPPRNAPDREDQRTSVLVSRQALAV